ncbi:unnamed protein product [Caenorhabditis nigoni]
MAEYIESDDFHFLHYSDTNYVLLLQKGLSVQCALPYIFYIPIYTLYYYCLITGREVLFLEFHLTLVPALPTIIDPLVSVYFVTPFRRKIMRWIKREREEIRTTSALTK